jgi:hypothetical protein
MMSVLRKLVSTLFQRDEHLVPVSVTLYERNRRKIYTVSWTCRGMTHVYRFGDNWKDELLAKVFMRRDRDNGLFSSEQYELAMLRLTVVQDGEHDAE